MIMMSYACIISDTHRSTHKYTYPLSTLQPHEPLRMSTKWMYVMQIFIQRDRHTANTHTGTFFNRSISPRASASCFHSEEFAWVVTAAGTIDVPLWPDSALVALKRPPCRLLRNCSKLSRHVPVLGLRFGFCSIRKKKTQWKTMSWEEHNQTSRSVEDTSASTVCCESLSNESLTGT